MKFFHVTIIACCLGAGPAAQAQDVPAELITALGAQGFEVTSTRYTWLGRIYVEASDGETDRAILIARRSGQILQDNLISGERTMRRDNATQPDDDHAPNPAPRRPLNNNDDTDGEPHADMPDARPPSATINKLDPRPEDRP